MADPLRVPVGHRQALQQLTVLAPEEFVRLHEVVRGGPTDSLESMLEVFRSASDSAGLRIDGGRLGEALLGLKAAQEWYSLDDHEVAVATSESLDLDLDDAARGILRERIEGLVSDSSLSILARAFDLASEHVNVYLRSRMISDLRPIYGSGLDRPEGIVITHSLRLDIQESGEVKSIYVGLNQEDLAELASVVQREADKAEGLMRLVEQLGLPLVASGRPASETEG